MNRAPLPIYVGHNEQEVYLYYVRFCDYYSSKGLPQWLRDKESTCNAGDAGSILESGRSLGGVNGNPLQYSCLKNPMDRVAWQATVQRVAKSQTQLSN